MDSSYFALFNLEPRFSLSLEALEAAFRALASRVHPDRFARAQAADRQRSLLLATQANEAYRTLRKPVLRARHLLALRGMPTGEQGAQLPKEVLIEHLELREALEETTRNRDASALSEFESGVQERTAALVRRLGAELDEARDNAAAALTVHQLMFFEKISAEIDDARIALGE